MNTSLNNNNKTTNVNLNNSRLYNSGAYAIHPHSHSQQLDSFSTSGGLAMSPPQPSRPPFDQVNSGPQQQSWFGGNSIDDNALSPTSPKLLTRDLMVSPSNSTTHTDSMYHTTEDDEVQQRHMQEMFDKRRRRRESHNLVERRRRDNINERIQELSSLLPSHLLDTNSNSVNIVTGSQRSPNMINKGTILKLSVDHIKELQEQVMRYQQRINDLEHIIHQGKMINYNHPSQQQQSQTPHPSTIQAAQTIQLLDNDKDHHGMRSQPSFQSGALTSNHF
ncbi:helix-loop-helix DNA-binding domain-containing protein [Chlamydoabsidia padenii]|nr:helix-loop-helix DNA-binding domain-containing protein [Chlamydoabsidia padenii]